MQQTRSVFLTTKSKTFSKDDTLPKLPVPKLSDTITRYLQSVRPHVDDTAFEKTTAIARQFEATDGAKLHKMLLQRAEKEINWVAHYWDTYAYLTLREPLIPYYSMGGSCKREDMPWPPHSTQIQQASLYSYMMLEFWQLLKEQKVAAHRAVDGKNFTMAQFRNLFNTSRRPGVGLDTIVSHFKTDASCPSHFVVMCKGRFFVIDALSGHSGILTAPELEVLYEQIMAKCSTYGDAVGALTCDNRDSWAKNRAVLESVSANNKTLLMTIETAIVIVVLEDCEAGSETAGMRHSLGGNLYNHWIDKSLALFFFKDGVVSSLCDHAAYDGMVSISAFQYIVTGMKEVQGVWQEDRIVRQSLAAPVEFQFDLDSFLREQIRIVSVECPAVTNTVCPVREPFFGYGKKFIQNQRLHPDAWVQLALQLAYYKNHKKPAPMYETATTRQFRDGRTETVRSCSIEATAFVKEMVHHPENVGKCRDLLLKAVAKHNELMNDARNGQGCDRHLFGLQCLAFENNIPMPELFKDPSWTKSGGSGNFYLSTSLLGYIPHGGVVAPMCLDGYGCFYNILEDKIMLAVSSWQRSSETSASKLVTSFAAALEQMQTVVLHSPAKI